MDYKEPKTRQESKGKKYTEVYNQKYIRHKEALINKNKDRDKIKTKTK